MANAASALNLVLAEARECVAVGLSRARWDTVAAALGWSPGAMIYKQPLNTGDVLLLRDFIDGPDRYHRELPDVCFTGDGPEGWTSDNLLSGGIGDVLDFPMCDLLYFPVNWATGLLDPPTTIGRLIRSAAATEKKGVIDVAFGALGDGVGFCRWQPLDANGVVVPIDTVAMESYPMMPVTLDRHGQAKDCPWYLTAYSDWEWHDDGSVAMHFYSVKSKALDTPQARPRPLDTRDWPAFGQTDWPKLTTLNYMPPMGQGRNYQPCKTLRGNVTTAGMQAYFVYDLTAIQPRMPVIDGEFGVARNHHTIDMRKGRLNKSYYMTPHSWRVSDSTGRHRTILGFYHTEAPYYKDVEALNALKVPTPHPFLHSWGIWPEWMPWYSRCPRLSWGGFFIDTTTVQGTSSELVQDSTMFAPETPHDGNGPQARVLNGYGGRVLRAQYHPRDHTVMPTVTIAATMEGAIPFNPLTGIDTKSDQIDIQDLHDGTYAVSERSAHRLSRWQYSLDPDVPDTFVEYLIQLPPGVTVTGYLRDHQYVCTSHPTMATARTVNVPIAPDGLDKVKGDPWLYIGAIVQGWLWRLNLDTRELQLVCPERDGTQAQTLLYQFSVSDGTTSPLGSLWLVDFDNQSSGPRIHLPIPGVINGVAYTHSVVKTFETVSYAQAVGVGPTLNSTYPMAVYAQQSCIMLGGTEEMQRVWRAPMPGDRLAPDGKRLTRGKAIYDATGGPVEWGPFAYGASSKPLLANDSVVDPLGDLAYWLIDGAGHYELLP